MNDNYQSIKDAAKGFYKEKGSKFLAFAYPVSNLEEVDKILVNIRKEYYDARHHCYAYILGIEGGIYRSYDDGEPRHTAGDPILNQIRSFHTSDVLLIVVRYFGGTKLGKSGLINAYKTAARDALMNAQIVKIYIKKEYKVSFGYECTSNIMNQLQKKEAIIMEQKYDSECSIHFSVRYSAASSLISEIEKIKAVIEIEEVSIQPPSAKETS